MTLLDVLAALLRGASQQSASTDGVCVTDFSRLTRLLPYVPGTIVYYTVDGTTAFRFRFELQANGDIRIYILEQPPYGGRDASPQTTHRLSDGVRRYICFEPLPRTREDARKLAKAWSELTLTYVRTGKRF